MSKLTPLGARILVSPTQQEKKTASGIFIPDTVSENPTTGTVVDVGTGTPDEPIKVKIGDNIMFGKHAGTEINITDENGNAQSLLLMNMKDVYGIIHD